MAMVAHHVPLILSGKIFVLKVFADQIKSISAELIYYCMGLLDDTWYLLIYLSRYLD